MATMTDKIYHDLQNLNWLAIFANRYVMKYQLDEDGYTLMVSDFAGGVYGEKLHEKAVQKRFEDLNPHVKIRPHVILRHVKHLIKHLKEGVQTHRETELDMCKQGIEKHYVERKVTIRMQFTISNEHEVNFIFELSMLSDNQFKEHVLRPTLLRALILEEEKAALLRKIEELEGKRSSSSSSGCARKRNIEAIYSAMNGIDPDGSDVVDSFLYFQNEILPKSPNCVPNVLPTKRVPRSSACSSLSSRLRNMAYEADYEQPEESNAWAEVFPKREMAEESNACAEVFPKREMAEESNERERVFPKREMAEENIKEEKPTPYWKPSPAKKKKKIIKF